MMPMHARLALKLAHMANVAIAAALTLTVMLSGVSAWWMVAVGALLVAGFVCLDLG